MVGSEARRDTVIGIFSVTIKQSLCFWAKIEFPTFFSGGLEAFEEKLRLEEEEKEAAKQRELDRRQEISKKTRSRLSELLDRKRAEVLLELER